VVSMCNVVHYSLFVFLYWALHVSTYTWPSSGAQVIVVKDSDARFNAGFLSPILVASGRAIAQAVSRWLPTAAARVRSRVW
jgi:hypothetical protein